MTSLNRPSLKKKHSPKNRPSQKESSLPNAIHFSGALDTLDPLLPWQLQDGFFLEMDHGGKDFNFKAFLSQPKDAETDEAVLHRHKLGPVGSDRLTQRWKYGFVWAPFFITTSAMRTPASGLISAVHVLVEF